MVAKGFLAAAAIIICCGTTLQGNDPDETCAGGGCPAVTSDNQPCSAEGKCCAEGKCDDKEERCEQEQAAVEKCSTEKCAFSAFAGGAYGSLKCALDGIATSACAAKGTCAKSNCSTETCAAASDNTCSWFCFDQDCPAGKCETACSSEANNGLKCAVEACLTASGGKITFTASKAFAGQPAPSKCSTEACNEKACSTQKCGAEKCSTSTCSTSKCASSNCSTEVCTEGICSTGKCGVEKCSIETCSETTCAAGQCSVSKCGKKACAATECIAGVGELETKLAQLEQLQRDVAALRSPAPNAEMYVVNVKMVELNRTRCRTLGWDLELADGCTTNEFANQTCAALEKRNLAKILCNPTLCVTSDRPASLAVGVEIPSEHGDGQSVSEFIGTKLDVIASPLPGNKVRLQIAPLISEICSSDQQARQVKIRKCDCVLDVTLGKSIVMKGISENRVRSITVEGRGPVEEVEEIQSLMVITVDRAENIDPQASVRQATYEKTLVEAVKEPEFVTKVYPVPDLQVWKVRPQGVEFDADLLVAHLKSTVDPQSWRGAVCASPADAENANGAIQPFERNGSLVICQTDENHERIANLFQKMRADGQQKDAAREERELRDSGVTPASAEEPVEQQSKCDKGACSESKCDDSKCSKSEVSLESESSDECPGDCQGECDGDCPETASCPCIGGTCTR